MNNDEAAVAALAGMGLVMLLVALIVAIFFLLTLSKTLSNVAPQNREMEPAMVWLNLIPLFNLVWIFFTVVKVADSLVGEAADRSLDFGDGGKALGIAYGALVVASIIPVIGMIAGLACLVVFIIYWVKIAGFKNQLVQSA